jgi:hypothetical protein
MTYWEGGMADRLTLGAASLAVTIVLATFSVGRSQDTPPQILRFVEGVDSTATAMPAGDIAAELNDPWGALVLRKGVFPANIDEVLAAIKQLDQGGAGLPLQSSFFVSESGQIPANAVPAPQREFRMVISRTAANGSSIVLVSAPAGDRTGFIELMSWDTTKQAFNFYRRPRTPDWVWKGDSRSAFQAGSAGQGCFACHVHGVPIMKELHRPWNNWNSQAANIPPDVIPEDIRTSLLFQKPPDGTKKGAEELESLLQGWITTGIAARVTGVMKSGTLTAAQDLVRPLFETTTVNLASSNAISAGRSMTLDLPMDFFINAKVLSDLSIDLPPGPTPSVARSLYQATLTKFGFILADDTFSRNGDTYFAFFVPVPSYADTQTIAQLIAQNVVTRHFATSVAMVDFPNPVYSAGRSRLLQYVPATAAVQAGGTDLSDRTALAIMQAAKNLPADSPEQRFAANWKLTSDRLKAQAAEQLKAYLDAVRAKLTTQVGFDDYIRLAQSRRNRFADSAVNESELKLLLPKTDIPRAELRMNADGSVTP